MGWSIGYDGRWQRDIGYGVPAVCDFPTCNEGVDRGLAYVCGSEPYGGEYGCGLYFCASHMQWRKPRGCEREIELCPRCYRYRRPYEAKPDCKQWIDWKLTDDSWQGWRDENPVEVALMISMLHAKTYSIPAIES